LKTAHKFQRSLGPALPRRLSAFFIFDINNTDNINLTAKETVMNTAGRRRRQAVGGYKHIHRAARPKYSVVSAEKSMNRLHRLIARQKEIAQRKGASKRSTGFLSTFRLSSRPPG